jgi:hypothetical protein
LFLLAHQSSLPRKYLTVPSKILGIYGYFFNLTCPMPWMHP